MPKDSFQDITPPGSSGNQGPAHPPFGARENAVSNASNFERTIRNIPINPRRERHTPSPDHDSRSYSGYTAPPASSGTRTFKFNGGNHLGVKKRVVWGIATIAVIALVIFTVAVFRGTSVVVTPRTHTIVLTEDVPLTAYPATDTKAPSGSLVYDIASNTYEAEQIVTAAGSEDVQEYARGVVTIYNEYSVTPMRLIKNTRFVGPNGLIFRVRDSVVVPGKKGVNPGTATATIYADQPGDKYNIGPVDRFALPGLKSTSPEMFSKVYARSVATFTGGFVGGRPQVAGADLENARKALRAGLEDKARTEATHLTVPKVVVFPQLLSITFDALDPVKGDDGQVRVRVRAVVSLPVFNEALFAKVLATATHADLGDSKVHFKDISALSMRKVTIDDKPVSGAVDLVASGSATLIWEVDTTALARALAGTPKETFQKITAGFAGIEEANAYIRPMWKQSFPADAAAISVILNESKPVKK